MASSFSTKLVPSTTIHGAQSTTAPTNENHGAEPGHDSHLDKGAAPQVAVAGASYALGVAMAMMALVI